MRSLGSNHSLILTIFKRRTSCPRAPCVPKAIKKTKFCDETVNSYVGYIDIEARHYFFESRSEPAKGNVIFWTDGDLGGSSSMGLFMELGPCRITSSSSPYYHQEAWNDKANVFFIDQPINVRFSDADYEEKVTSTEDAAVDLDLAAFVAVFFEHLRQFQGNGFHVTGESCGGVHQEPRYC